MKFIDSFIDVTKHVKKLPTSEYLDLGKYPIIDQGQKQIAGYTDIEEGLFTDVPAIIFGDHTRVIKYIDTPFFIGADGVKVIKCLDKQANYNYLYYLLSSVRIPNTGYNRHYKWLKEAHLVEHTKEEQEKIVSVLSTIDNILNLCFTQINKLDVLVKSRFVEMFGEPSLNPMGWENTTIGNACYYIKDGPHKSLPDVGEGNGYPFISVRNIVKGDIDFSTARYISKEDYIDSIKKCYPQKGDILYSKGGTTGIAKLIDVDIEFANWVHLAVLKFDKSLNGVFFEHMLNCDYCYNQSQRLTKGIANRDLVLSAMSQIKMYKPPIELQNKFAAFVAQIDKSKLVVKKQIEKLETLKKSLMQEYFG